MLSKEACRIIFLLFGMTRPGIESRSPETIDEHSIIPKGSGIYERKDFWKFTPKGYSLYLFRSNKNISQNSSFVIDFRWTQRPVSNLKASSDDTDVSWYILFF